MNSKTISPKIKSLQWGRLKVGNHLYKDAKLFPGGSRKWDWNETGTHHIPGIQPADVEELIDHGAKIIILSKGINERLQVSPNTVEMLKNQEYQYYILQTEKAVAKYNQLCATRPVGALIHSTC